VARSDNDASVESDAIEILTINALLRSRCITSTLSEMVVAVLGGSVVSENALASAVGARVFAKGGNAVDAIIATAIAVNTTSPYHSDLGGGGFAIFRTPAGEFQTINFRSMAPVGAFMNVNLTTGRGHA